MARLAAGAAQPPGATAKPACRAVLASNTPETLDELGAYLNRAGISTRGVSRLSRLADVVPGATALVLFPDDFSWDVIASVLEPGGAAIAGTFVVLVTGFPRRFEAFRRAKDLQRMLVVPKPAWGWIILDAIRTSHAQGGDGVRS